MVALRSLCSYPVSAIHVPEEIKEVIPPADGNLWTNGISTSTSVCSLFPEAELRFLNGGFVWIHLFHLMKVHMR